MMSDKFTHLNDHGDAHMVDVAEKLATGRMAVAKAVVVMEPATLQAIKASEIKKGDVLATARIAGIMATKKCGDLIPLCHPLSLEHVSIEFAYLSDHEIEVTCQASLTAKTGVEMEALCGASVAAMTIYDMCKAIDRAMMVDHLRITHKSGGKSGVFKQD